MTQINRRRVIQGTAAVGALALPAGAAVGASVSPGEDPHIAWWRERRRLNRAIDELENSPHADPLVSAQGELDDRIVGTPPTTLEGAAIVATALLWWQSIEERTPGLGDIDAEAGGTLARYFLATLPADVMARAGVEGRS